jgi:type III secretory pathway component EscS
VGPAWGFSLGFVLLAKSTVLLGALFKSAAQLQESWMPLGKSIVCQAFVTSIIAEIIEKAFAHFGSFRVAMNVAERV